jgi:hypothetical protein
MSTAIGLVSYACVAIGVFSEWADTSDTVRERVKVVVSAVAWPVSLLLKVGQTIARW